MIVLFLRGTNVNVSAQNSYSRDEILSTLSDARFDTSGVDRSEEFLQELDDWIYQSLENGVALNEFDFSGKLNELGQNYDVLISTGLELMMGNYFYEKVESWQSEKNEALLSSGQKALYAPFVGEYSSTHMAGGTVPAELNISVELYTMYGREDFHGLITDQLLAQGLIYEYTTESLSFFDDGTIFHDTSEGIGYADYHFSTISGNQINLSNTNGITSKSFYYNEKLGTYDLISVQQLESDDPINTVKFWVYLTRFVRIEDESSTASSNPNKIHTNIIELHQAFEASKWIQSPEALEAYHDFQFIVENSSFGNLGTDTREDAVIEMMGRNDVTAKLYLTLFAN